MSNSRFKESKGTMEPREIKGLEIAAKLKLVRKGNTWHVPSQSNKQEKYTVALTDDKPQCTCRDYEFRNDKCKHIFAVEYTIEREQTADGQTVVTETVKVTRRTYPQNWPAYNAAQTHEKTELQGLLYELCRSIPEPEQKMGRPRLSLADIVFSSTFKVYSTVSGRRFMSDLREAKARGFLAKLPSYNSVFRYLEAQVLTPYLFELIATSALPLKSVETKFAVDSSGFSTGQFMRWLDVKYGKEEDRRMWIKLHLMCGVTTNIVTSVEVSDAYANDYNFYKPLLEITAGNGFKMAEVTADKAYLGAPNLLTTLQHGAIPYIPFKTNSKAGQSTYGAKSTLWDRMFHFYNLHREEFLTHYHQRSNVETTFHMIKAKFGQRLRSKTMTAQINEALCKVLCHNLCVVIQSVRELGIEATFGADLAQHSTPGSTPVVPGVSSEELPSTPSVSSNSSAKTEGGWTVNSLKGVVLAGEGNAWGLKIVVRSEENMPLRARALYNAIMASGFTVDVIASEKLADDGVNLLVWAIPPEGGWVLRFGAP